MGYKTIKRDEGGNWQPIDMEPGTVGKNEINKRHELREQEMKDAIAKDSKGGMTETHESDHPVLQSALSRLRNEPGRWQPEHSEKQYRSVHGDDPNTPGSDDAARKVVHDSKNLRDSGPSDYNKAKENQRKESY